ncbi:hypothetical protein [uncultured Paraglaciecola sp.]|uniref:hypothetical protein n=1 Tax=uncultured Paraglaciecola sp. TaxID=1765024 RepID=UPI0030D7814E|tara:strand:+ start:38636 stop:39136 length:501 start_codon:yes stop_codon:yes gene_type:complete
MDFNWQGIITSAITVGLITYAIKSANHSVEKGQLKYGLFIKGLGIVCLICCLVPLWVYLTDGYKVNKLGEATALIGLMIGFGIFSICTIGEGFFVKGSYDESSINFSTPWTGSKANNWRDLKSVKFNILCFWYVLQFNDGNTIRISSYLGGNCYLLDSLREKGDGF